MCFSFDKSDDMQYDSKLKTFLTMCITTISLSKQCYAIYVYTHVVVIYIRKYII